MKSLRQALLTALALPASLLAQNNTFPSTGNAGIGTTNPGNNNLQIVRDLGTNDYTYVGQHQMHLRIRRASDLKAVELGVLDNGVAVLQASEAGVGYNSLALNPVAGNVGIGTTNPLGKLNVFNINGYDGVETNWAADSISLYGAVGNALGSYFGGITWHNGGRRRAGIASVMEHDDSDYVGIAFFTQGTDGSGSMFESMRIAHSGFVGIGTMNPLSKLTVAGAVRLDNGTEQSSYFATIAARYDSSHPFSLAVENNTGGSPSEVIGVYSPGGGGYLNLAVGLNGNVGVGTTSPTHKLSVNGAIRAKEVIVDTGWADYVFAEDYRLAPLSEVEAHIKAHKHLPDMPSAAEVAEEGVSMGEMQARMMAKIEELTLHVIEQEKRIQRLETENFALRGR